MAVYLYVNIATTDNRAMRNASRKHASRRRAHAAKRSKGKVRGQLDHRLRPRARAFQRVGLVLNGLHCLPHGYHTATTRRESDALVCDGACCSQVAAAAADHDSADDSNHPLMSADAGTPLAESGPPRAAGVEPPPPLAVKARYADLATPSSRTAP